MIFPFNAGEVFKIAIKIEENGRLFYEKAAAGPFPEMIQNLFAGLAKEEIEHKAVFQTFLNKLPGAVTAATVWDPENELDQYLKMMADSHVFNRTPAEMDTLLAGLSNSIDAVKMAMGFERDTIVFFLEMAEVSDSGESRAFIAHLLNEERGHLRKLADVLGRLTR